MSPRYSVAAILAASLGLISLALGVAATLLNSTHLVGLAIVVAILSLTSAMLALRDE